MLYINGTAYSMASLLTDSSALKVDSTAIKTALFSRTGVSPSLAAAVDVTPAATAWKLGAAAALVATGGITTAFQITGVNVESIGTTCGDCEIIVYEGTAASSAVASVRFFASTGIKAAGTINGLHFPVVTKQIAANKCVYAKCAALTTTVPVPAISINYKVV